MRAALPVLLTLPALLCAHPLGNFSVNHYTRFEARPGGVEIRYVIDLAEIPSFDLLSDWGLDRSSSPELLRSRSLEQARTWAGGLSLRVDGKPVRLAVSSAELVMADGAANLPLVRISARMTVQVRPGRLEYEDRNFDGRPGWKEIVIAAADGASLERASQTAEDRSQALTQYPPDPLAAPPQDLRAEFVWAGPAPARARQVTEIHKIPQPASPPAPPSPAVTAKNAPAGTVVKNDFLSRLLRSKDIPARLILIAALIAFGLGAAHALTPGHGKTIVAAYLVGSRGTLKHAAFLGGVVTFTHTVSVFALGLVTMFLFRFVVPERITEILGVISGLSIVVLGAWMLYRRATAGRHHHHHHHGPHHHHHDHDHDHDHHHHHDDSHSHLPEGDLGWGSLTTLAVSGGLVPCESALVLLLGAIALGRTGLGLVLLSAFSLGLATVLMAVGALVLYAKKLLPASATNSRGAWARWVPVASAAVVVVVGVITTVASLGLLPA